MVPGCGSADSMLPTYARSARHWAPSHLSVRAAALLRDHTGGNTLHARLLLEQPSQVLRPDRVDWPFEEEELWRSHAVHRAGHEVTLYYGMKKAFTPGSNY
jgi:hypothetical protein